MILAKDRYGEFGNRDFSEKLVHASHHYRLAEFSYEPSGIGLHLSLCGSSVTSGFPLEGCAGRGDEGRNRFGIRNAIDPATVTT